MSAFEKVGDAAREIESQFREIVGDSLDCINIITSIRQSPSQPDVWLVQVWSRYLAEGGVSAFEKDMGGDESRIKSGIARSRAAQMADEIRELLAEAYWKLCRRLGVDYRERLESLDLANGDLLGDAR